jgi:hypothetical protein
MDFKLVYLSQKDKQWENDILGFGTGKYDTIGWNGCALTSVAMLLSGYGFTTNPHDLNNDLKGINGFAGSGIKWQEVPRLYSKVKLSESPYVNYAETGVPLAKINAALQAGRPVVVRVDTKPSEDPGKPDDHYVLIYSRNGNDDYLMLDPYPSQISGKKPESLMDRYGFGRPLNRVIERLIFYEVTGYSGHIEGASISAPTPTSQTGSAPRPAPAPASTPVPKDGVYVRVLASVGSLSIRSSKDASGSGNVVASVPGGTLLRLLDPPEAKRLGKPGKWITVREPNGAKGFAEVQYLENRPAR